MDDKFELSVDQMQLRAITRACRLINDQLKVRLPIDIKLLETILFETERLFQDQPYLSIMYQAIFSIAYYGLLRIGEIAKGAHSIKAADVLIGVNKNKIQLTLYTSKTHDEAVGPQKIKIAAVPPKADNPTQPNILSHTGRKEAHFCPFNLINKYMKIRGDFESLDEQFFVFNGLIPIEQSEIRATLSTILSRIGKDSSLFSFHSFRAGCVTDLYKWGFTIEQIKDIGRWKSNAVYRYLKN